MDYQYHIFSPYRVCPLGAHVDHQHGLVTGFAIDKGVDLWFDVREDSLVKLIHHHKSRKNTGATMPVVQNMPFVSDLN